MMELGVSRQFTFAPTADAERSTFTGQKQLLYTPTQLTFANHVISVDVVSGNLTVRIADVQYEHYRLPFGITRSYDAQRVWGATSADRLYPNVTPKPSWFGDWQFGWEAQIDELWRQTTYDLHVLAGVGINSMFRSQGRVFRRGYSSEADMRAQLLSFGVADTVLDAGGWNFSPGDLLLRTDRGPFRLVAGRSAAESLTDPQQSDLWIFDPTAGTCWRVTSRYMYDHLQGSVRDCASVLLLDSVSDSLGHCVTLAASDDQAPFANFVLSDGARTFRFDLGSEYLCGDCLNAAGVRRYRRVSQVADGSAGGRIWSYTYADNSLSLARVQVNGPIGARAVTYRYGEGNVPDLLSSIEDALGNRIEFAYAEDPDDLDERRNPRMKIARITDPTGAIFRYSFSPLRGRSMVEVRRGDVVDTEREYGYIRDSADTRQRFVSEELIPIRRGYALNTEGGVVGLSEPVTRAKYRRYSTADGRYNVEAEWDAQGRTTSFEYNEYNLLTGVRDYGGHWTHYVYDVSAAPSRVNPLRFDVLEVNRYELLRVAVPGDEPRRLLDNGLTLKKEFTYERYSGETSQSETDSHQSTHRVASETDERRRSWQYSYDNLRDHKAPQPSRLVDPAGGVITRRYDEHGSIVAESDQEGLARQFHRNSIGAVDVVTDPNGREWTIDYYDGEQWPRSFVDPEGGETRCERDPVGQIRRLTDPVGDAVNYGYDSAGRLCAIRPERKPLPAEFGTTAWNGTVTTAISYNPFGRMTSLTDGRGQVLQFEYDEADQLIHWGHADAGDGWRQVYDNVGQLIATTDPGGRSVTHQYNADGTRLRTRYPEWKDGDERKPGKTVSYLAYDYSGRPLEVNDSELGTLAFAYDETGKQVYKRLEDGTGEESSYDDNGNLSTLSSSDGLFVLGREFDRKGRVTELRDSAYLDAAALWRFAYRNETPEALQSVLLSTRTLQEGALTTKFEYTPSGRRSAIAHSVAGEGGSLPIFTQRSEMLGDGRIKSLTGDNPCEFIRDSLKQLVHETATGLISDFDMAGNRIYRRADSSGPLNSFRYPNRLASNISPSAAIEYDLSGAPQTIESAEERCRFAFDGAGCLRVCETQDVSISYVYDDKGHLRQRHLKQKATGQLLSTAFRYCEGRPIVVRTNDQPAQVLTWDHTGSLLRVRSSALTGEGRYRRSIFLLDDFFGSPSRAVSGTFNVTGSIDYSAWGEVIRSSGVNDFSFVAGWQSGQYDPATGLVRFGRRWYSPAFGRWISEDDASGADPRRHRDLANLYRFCNNDPTYFRDPTGLGIDPMCGFEKPPPGMDDLQRSLWEARQRPPRDPKDQAEWLRGRIRSHSAAMLKCVALEAIPGTVIGFGAGIFLEVAEVGHLLKWTLEILVDATVDQAQAVFTGDPEDPKQSVLEWVRDKVGEKLLGGD